jgi:hypothetical protein
MSPASYLTAPPRDAAKIVAPPGHAHTLVTMAGMPLLAWVSLVFLVLALVVTITVAVVRALRMWRTYRTFSDAFGPSLEHVQRTAAEAERHANALNAKTEQLNSAVERLQQSLAALAVLRAAAEDARATLSLRKFAIRK